MSWYHLMKKVVNWQSIILPFGWICWHWQRFHVSCCHLFQSFICNLYTEVTPRILGVLSCTFFKFMHRNNKNKDQLYIKDNAFNMLEILLLMLRILSRNEIFLSTIGWFCVECMHPTNGCQWGLGKNWFEYRMKKLGHINLF